MNKTVLNCPLCYQNQFTRWQIKKKPFPYYHCQNCDLIFIDPSGIIHPQEEKKRYLKHNNTHDNRGYINYLKGFLSFAVLPYQKQIKSILDFGSGPTPVLADILKENSFYVDIYDPYFYNTETFLQKKYDCITATEVWEHLNQPGKEIAKLINSLAQKGILSVMTLFHPPSKEKFEKWWYKEDITHYSFFSLKTFEFICQFFQLELLQTNHKDMVVMQKK
ncbi:MAG: class I SAM-dependent methyltransferase [Spirochaetes bacterium]|nr:class I SAM-dependent methyltransferase [Spirochaetota bacterium]